MSPLNKEFIVGSSFRKVDEDQRIIEGYASTEKFDSASESIKMSAVKAAIDQYLRFPTLRIMHRLEVAGKVTAAVFDKVGLYVTAKIEHDETWKFIKAGVYKGFSVGGKITSRDSVNPRVVTGIQLTEISIVDVPCNDSCLIDIVKAAGVRAPTGTRAVAKLPDEAEVRDLVRDRDEAQHLIDTLPDTDPRKWDARGRLAQIGEKMLSLQFAYRHAIRHQE
jgi:phage head maturation protease